MIQGGVYIFLAAFNIHKRHPEGPLGSCADFTESTNNSVFAISMVINIQVTVQVSVT